MSSGPNPFFTRVLRGLAVGDSVWSADRMGGFKGLEVERMVPEAVSVSRLVSRASSAGIGDELVSGECGR